MLTEETSVKNVHIQILTTEFGVARKTLAKLGIATAIALAVPVIMELGDGTGGQTSGGALPAISHPVWIHA